LFQLYYTYFVSTTNYLIHLITKLACVTFTALGDTNTEEETGGDITTPGADETGGDITTPGADETGGDNTTPGADETGGDITTPGADESGGDITTPGADETGGDITTPGADGTGGDITTPGADGTGGDITTFAHFFITCLQMCSTIQSQSFLFLIFFHCHYGWFMRHPYTSLNPYLYTFI
jgi:hypothetical protein